ncbi:MAG: hypothetical protein LBT12_07875, partial [Oscillospiraceae bacterium]|nr:hypothetical protein [Oscillospiraceae bacterium]
MKCEKLFAALGGADDMYIEEAAYPEMTPLRTRGAQQPRRFSRLAPAAACLILAAAAALILPRLQNHDLVGGQPGSGQLIGDGNPEYDDRPGEGVPVPPRPSALSLIINTAVSVSAAEAAYPGNHFDLDLSEEQLRAVFPGVDLTLGASAHYREDGSVMFVTAAETRKPG